MSETTKKPKLPRYRGHSRLTKAGQGGNLTIPSDMMILLTEGLLFKPELVKDGILFKIVDENKMVADDKAVPAWVKKAVVAPETTLRAEEPEDEDTFVAIVNSVEDEEPPVTDDDSPF